MVPREMATTRERLVSELPTRVDSSLLGQPLASPVRRLGALIVDVTIVMIPSIAVAVGAAVLTLWLTNPEALSAIAAELRHTPETEATASIARLGQLAPVLVRGEAEGLPPTVAVAVEQGDLHVAGEILSGYTIDFALGTNIVRKPGVVRLHIDRLIPDFVRGAALFGVAAMYFTVLTALGRGSTFGKRLFGIQVRKLDAHPLTVWESFERFGGYFGSVGTLGLGFLDLWREPNRRLAHDRTSNTVVVRRRQSHR